MIAPNTLAYERWLDMFAAPALAITVNYDNPTTGRTGDDASADDYRLDLSTGSYAVQAHDFATQFTPARWFETISSGSRDTAAEPVELALHEELAGAL